MYWIRPSVSVFDVLPNFRDRHSFVITIRTQQLPGTCKTNLTSNSLKRAVAVFQFAYSDFNVEQVDTANQNSKNALEYVLFRNYTSSLSCQLSDTAALTTLNAGSLKWLCKSDSPPKNASASRATASFPGIRYWHAEAEKSALLSVNHKARVELLK